MRRSIALCAVMMFAVLLQPAQAAGSRVFPETNQTVSGQMLEFWQNNGGLDVFGLPVSDQRRERTYTGTATEAFAVQHFERNRFELHPENAAPYNVLLGRLGDDALRRQGRDWRQEPSAENPLGGVCVTFAETDRRLCGPFLDYWTSHGLDDPQLNNFQRALALFGLPLTGVKAERNSSGDTVLTQWFERARFEYHPGNPEPYKVQLGRLGAELYAPQSPNGEPTRYKAVALPELGQILTIPDGFEISVAAMGLNRPRFMALDPSSGDLFVAEQDVGSITRWVHVANDKLEKRETLLNLPLVSSLTFVNGRLVAAAETELVFFGRAADGSWQRQSSVPLPSGSRDLYGHRTRSVVTGPDGMLYVSIGSSCDLCEETDPLRATVTRFSADGSGAEVFARGLRNSVGIAFRPGTAELWGVDNGRNGLGDAQPPEELNRLEQGQDYGWPYCHGDRLPSPEYNNPGRCAGTQPPAWTMTAHTAPLGLAFYDGLQLPPSYQGDAIVARHGTAASEVSQLQGYDVLRIKFKDGRPVAQETLISGWLVDNQWWGRPVGVTIDLDGSILISDDGSGRIFRLRYTGT